MIVVPLVTIEFVGMVKYGIVDKSNVGVVGVSVPFGKVNYK